MKLVTRAQWGGPSNIGSSANPTRGCVAHYNGGPIGLKDKAHSACLDYVRRVHRMHLGQGWAGIGYSFLVCQHGYVIEGRGLSRTQAAQPGGNTSHYSIQMMVGGAEEPTDAQVQAWRDARAYIRRMRSVSGHVGKHSDFISTSCAGVPTNRLVASGALAGRGSSAPAPGPAPAPGRPAPGPRVDFPLPSGHYFGPKTGPTKSVSGWYGRTFKGRPDYAWLKTWAGQLGRRGWGVGKGRRFLARYGNDGRYGSEYRDLIEAFQRDQNLPVTGRLDRRTWDAAYTNPIS
jgi:hypothetical protein